ncbi:MAG: hypothetical protein IJ776_06795 [Paludibacteraceae bacterium]|nr:hypothetical protein [Paludibacteraceae bacterium]
MKNLYIFNLLLLAITLFSACNNPAADLPVVTTGNAQLFASSRTAACDGAVVSEGGGKVIERGICYTQGIATPDISSPHVSSGTGKGQFYCSLPDIGPGTWSYRAYAVNEAGTAYGDALSFTMTADSNGNTDVTPVPGGGSGGSSGDNTGGNTGGDNTGGNITQKEIKTIEWAINEINSKYSSPGAKSTEMYRFKVKIDRLMTLLSTIPSPYNDVNMRVYDETGSILSYYTKYLDNQPFTSSSQVPLEGSEIYLKAYLCNYSTTEGTIYYELQNGYIEEVLTQGRGIDMTPPAAVKAVTVAQFLAAPENLTQYYQLTGTVSNITNTTRGRFDLTDATGTVYIYGLTETYQPLMYDGEAYNDGSFRNLNISDGSTVTICGLKHVYNDNNEMFGAYFIK